MSKTKSIQWYAERYINKFNMSLVPIKPKSKLPIRDNWGEDTLDTDAEAQLYYADNPDHNVGLSLGKSGYCSLDIDCEESFRIILDEFGIDPATLDAYPTIRGKDSGRRVMFRVPADLLIDYHKLSWPSKLDPDGSIHRQMMRDAKNAMDNVQTEEENRIREDAKKYSSYAVIELRTATPGGTQRFDLLPPSIHPDTQQPYVWLVQPQSPWPEPPAWLLAIWTAWDRFKPQLKSACPWAPEEAPATAPTRQPTPPGQDGSVIDKYIAAHSLTDALTQYGYKQIGKRWLSPHSSTKLPGVILFPDGASCWIHHASDPLCSEDTGRPVNAFDLFCYYDHGNDTSKAVKAAAEQLGLASRPAPRREPPAVTADPGNPDPVQAAPTPAAPFRALGYNNTHYYYLPRATEQVAEISRRGHTSPAEMLALAPVEWWEAAYPSGGKSGGADWQWAASELMRSCERRGIYDPYTERGRGAWYDDGRAVLHLGDRLLVNGHPARIADHVSRYIYTRQSATEADIGAIPATDEQGAQILQILHQLNWSKPSYALMAAGWIALAPICGALSWRPHVWITAQRGSGKSWMQEHIIAPLVGSSALVVQGGTTEAGIRQRLRQDARPIVFDEAEPDGVAGQKRIQSVIELARQASSDGGAEIVKGTSGGEGMSFRARSMFLMGSVNVALVQAADESRFTVLSLDSPEKTPAEIERFTQFAREVDATLTKELCAAMRSRIYGMIPVIRKNAATFARAVAEELGSQRLGDQIGTLLAGSQALLGSREWSLADARALAATIDLDDATEAEAVSDEINCMDAILQAQIRFDSDEGRMMTRTVSELVMVASGGLVLAGVGPSTANQSLERHGVKVEGGYMLIANRHGELSKMLQNTPWAAGWKTVIKRIQGASACKSPVRLAGVLCRCTRIPTASFF